MSHQGYIYCFDAITDKPSKVQFTNPYTYNTHSLHIAVNDSQFLFKRHHQMPPEIADLVDIAVAVYVADRLSIPKSGMQRNIHIVLPVRHPEIFGSSQVGEYFKEVLHWYTNDHWSFEFIPRDIYGRQTEIQMCMPLTDNSAQSIEVALWSGGLDALAGLYNRSVVEHSNFYILFGTGANTFIHSIQQKVAKAFNKKFPDRTVLVQVPILLYETKNLPKSSSQRTRGFIFMLLGAVCAHMEGQNTLYIYENGIGAINLPFRESEVGLDHARSVHPLSLLRMGDLVSELIGKPFAFRNPFLFYTKAQMCEIFTSLAVTDLVFQTVSCDRRHRERLTQCGCCSSCLLRRQALAVQRIEDQTPYVILNAHLRGKISKPSYGDHLRAMRDQVHSLHSLLNSGTPWASISKKHTVLSDIVDWTAKQHGIALEPIREQLVQLYKCYVDEWDNNSVQYILSRGLLEEWEMQKSG